MNYIIKSEKEFKTIKSAFRAWQKEHPNCLTNEIIKLDCVDDLFIIELSEGQGISQKNPIWCQLNGI